MHWKKYFNYAYTGAYELAPGEERTLTIGKTTQEELVGADGKKQMCFVAYFNESSKPMVLNRTNCKTIEELYGPDTENWVGKLITIHAEPVKAFGKTRDALRILNRKPTGIKVSYDELAAKLTSCKTIEELRTTYAALPKDVQAGLTTVKDEMKSKLTAK